MGIRCNTRYGVTRLVHNKRGSVYHIVALEIGFSGPVEAVLD